MEGHASMQRGGYGRTCINEEVIVWKDMHQCRGEGMEGHASMQREGMEGHASMKR